MKATGIKSILILGLACAMLFPYSCANTTTPPSGGPKDTIPPVLLKVVPENGTTGFPLTGGKVTFTYDEYSVVKTSSEIVVSPPSKRRPTTKVRGKSIVISFQDTLQPDRTYSINLGLGIADNNEGNIAPQYVYAFSTGDTVDSLYMTGTVVDCRTLEPVKGAIVAVYSDLSDSACFKTYPDAASRSDQWGFFSLRHIGSGPYRVIAFSDTDNDWFYNADTDNVAFEDSLYTPHEVVRDSIYELGSFDMKDTLACNARKPMLELRMFKESQSIQYLQRYGRKSDKAGFLKFSAENVSILGMEWMGIDSNDVVLQYNPTRDSLDFWITSKYNVGDSLILRLDYMKTDSTGVLEPFHETIAMGMPTDSLLLDAEMKRDQDSLFSMKVRQSAETFEHDGVILDAPWPLIEINPDSILFTCTNPKNQTDTLQLELTKDSTVVTRYILRYRDSLQVGYNYEVTIPEGTFIDMYGKPSKKESFKLALPQSEDLSSITLVLSDVDGRYIVELLGADKKNAQRTFTVENDCTLQFKYLKAGNFAIRIAQDPNRNGAFDMGNLLERRQPERVVFYRFSQGTDLLELPERTDLEQEINIKDLFVR